MSESSERTETLVEVATALERLRITNPMNGDGSNHMLTLTLNTVAKIAGDDRESVIAAVTAVRDQRDADDLARYQRLRAEDEARRTAPTTAQGEREAGK